MKDRNLVILSGMVSSEIRRSISLDGIDQSDFKLKVTHNGIDGKQYEQDILCRVLGKSALNLPTGSQEMPIALSLEGNLRTSPNKRSYVESWYVQIDS